MTNYYILDTQGNLQSVCDDNACQGVCRDLIAQNNGTRLYNYPSDARHHINPVGSILDGGFALNYSATTKPEGPRMLLDTTSVTPAYLSTGDVFVWENTEQVRDRLVVSEDHVLRVYRVTSIDQADRSIRYVPASGTPETHVKYWDAATTLYRVDPAQFPVPETFPCDVSLSDAMAAAGVGGEITRMGHRYRVTMDGGLVDLTAGRDYTNPHRDLLTYGWNVTAVGDAAASATSTPTPTNLLPRTAQDARTLASMLTDLADKLPGGELERAGHELAENRSLCEVYERVVTEVFGWSPREGMGRGRQYAWLSSIESIERDHAGNLFAMLRTAAQRYERGGVVNQAIIDAMRSNLESHKVDDVNEVLERCGLDGLETTREFAVTARVEGWALQTRRVPVHQYVRVTVEARDEHDAIELAAEHEDLTSLTTSYEWEWDGDEDCATEWDTDLYDVQDETEDWDTAEAEEV